MPDEVIPVAPPAATPTEAPAPSPTPSVPSAPVGESSSPVADTSSSAGATVESGAPSGTSHTDSTSTPAAVSSAKPANEFQPSLLDGATAQDSAKPADKAADAAKPSEAPGETPSAPITYEFAYPEGFDSSQVNSERMGAYTGILGENKIAKETGQKLLDLHLQELNTAAEKLVTRQWEVFNQTQDKWRAEVRSDPVLGKLDHEGKMTAIPTIMSLIDLYGGDAKERAGLLESGKITGWANNPYVLRFLHRAAENLAKEAKMTTAQPVKMPQPAGRERGLSRYKGTTPFQG